MSQLDLFGNIQPEQNVSQKPDAERIRLILNSALQELRKAESMPWDAPGLRSWQHVFANMPKWLPEHERLEIIRQFNTELARLRGEPPIFDRLAG